VSTTAIEKSGNNLSGQLALVLGGTGAMGVYMVPELAARGCEVTVVSLDEAVSDNPNIKYIKANGKDIACLKDLLSGGYDAIVDFLMYPGDEFNQRYELLLENTGHYVYLSSYRVYDGVEVPVTEKSPRLLDNSKDEDFLATDDYSLFKARGEDLLQNSKYDNWTVVRPAITYSKFRYQLVTLEASIVVARALKGLPVVLPREALSVQGTMSWAGDVAKMFAGLVLNPEAYKECFTLATAEHHSWGEIAEYYKEIIGLEYYTVNNDEYIKIMGGTPGAGYQLNYDRMFDRIIDNSKILQVAGLKQEDFMPLRKGLEMELSALPKDTVWPAASAVWERMDEYIKNNNK